MTVYVLGENRHVVSVPLATYFPAVDSETRRLTLTLATYLVTVSLTELIFTTQIYGDKQLIVSENGSDRVKPSQDIFEPITRQVLTDAQRDYEQTSHVQTLRTDSLASTARNRVKDVDVGTRVTTVLTLSAGKREGVKVTATIHGTPVQVSLTPVWDDEETVTRYCVREAFIATTTEGEKGLPCLVTIIARKARRN